MGEFAEEVVIFVRIWMRAGHDPQFSQAIIALPIGGVRNYLADKSRR